LTVNVSEQRIVTNAIYTQVFVGIKLVGIEVIADLFDFGFSEFGANRMLGEAGLSFRQDAVELHHDRLGKYLRPRLILGPQAFFEPRDARLGNTHHGGSRFFEALRHLPAHMVDAVLVLDQPHSNTHL
jgi:hypothetical protein